MSTNFDTAQGLVYGPEKGREAVMLRANAMATLALVDELRAAREAAGPESGFRHAYALTRRTEGDQWADTVSIYLVRESAMEESASLNRMAVRQGSNVTWGVTTHILKEG